LKEFEMNKIAPTEPYLSWRPSTSDLQTQFKRTLGIREELHLHAARIALAIHGGNQEMAASALGISTEALAELVSRIEKNDVYINILTREGTMKLWRDLKREIIGLALAKSGETKRSQIDLANDLGMNLDVLKRIYIRNLSARSVQPVSAAKRLEAASAGNGPKVAVFTELDGQRPLKDIQRDVFSAALEYCGNKQGVAADGLGVTRTTLSRYTQNAGTRRAAKP
jgi:DNA-binding NtrC family response regulator